MLKLNQPTKIPVENSGYHTVMIRSKRCPLKGEYFLSGARPTAYKAPNDLSTQYHIVTIID